MTGGPPPQPLPEGEPAPLPAFSDILKQECQDFFKDIRCLKKNYTAMIQTPDPKAFEFSEIRAFWERPVPTTVSSPVGVRAGTIR